MRDIRKSDIILPFGFGALGSGVGAAKKEMRDIRNSDIKLPSHLQNAI
jgi:hypothetical protein